MGGEDVALPVEGKGVAADLIAMSDEAEGEFARGRNGQRSGGLACSEGHAC